MWELMAIGIEMQQRMIETHAKGLDLTRDMLRSMELQADPGEMLAQAHQAQVDLAKQWTDYWQGRS